MTDRIEKFGLQVARSLHDMIETEALPGTGIGSDQFWKGLSSLVHTLGPKNRALLARRDALQQQIDGWHKARKGKPVDAAEYTAFLKEIGYLVPEGPDFSVDTQNVDPEIASIPGPQLVVPVMNARYALNAANARWGSLYDALYGTDAMGEAPQAGGYDPERGAKVIAWAKAFLDDVAPLAGASHAAVTGYRVADGALVAQTANGEARLADPSSFAGYRGAAGAPSAVLLRHHRLHLEIRVDRAHSIGATDAAGVADVLMEAAITTIMDCEDSVAAVDADDKALAYRNWLGLMNGTLVEKVAKGGSSFDRKLNPDREYTGADGKPLVLKGRSLMLVRNVGHLMTNPAVLDRDGQEVYEGLLDAMCTVTIAIHDLKKQGGSRNSTQGSVYVVKPKMHGPEEVAFADEIFTQVESALGLPANTVKIGIMTRSAARRSTSRSASVPPATAWPSSTPASWTALATRSTRRWKPGPWCARAR